MTRLQVLKSLRGVICPVTTPFSRRGGIDEGFFRENLSRLSGVGLTGVLVAGSTGEAAFLGERERLRLVEIAREVVKEPELVMAGTGLEGTAATIDLSREAVARGADALLVLTPNYYKPAMSADALTAHYKAVGAAVKRPVLIYSIPQYTGLTVEPATIGRLSKLPNVVGLKESSGKMEFIRGVMGKVKPGFLVLVGHASIFYEALDAGAVAGVLGVANYAPALCVALYQAFLRRQAAEAKELQQRLVTLGQNINVPHGVAGIKAALDLCGSHGGSPRLPLLPVSAQAKKRIATVLRDNNAALAM